MVKAYAYESLKYSGAITDNFERKLKFFYERAEQCGVTAEDMSKAF